MTTKVALINKKFRVLDKGWVELQDVMGSDQDIVNAARVSFLGDSKGIEQDKKLLLYLYKHRHTSPFEQAELKFRIKAPLVTFWQLVRHRTANINMQSGRYTEFNEDEFYLPDVMRKQSKSNKQASEGTIDADTSDTLNNALKEHYAASYAVYRRMIDSGVSREMARLALPGFAVYYTCVWKIDLHNLLHFLSLRMQEEAQYEIRVYAETIYREIVKPLFPWTSEAFEQGLT